MVRVLAGIHTGQNVPAVGTSAQGAEAEKTADAVKSASVTVPTPATPADEISKIAEDQTQHSQTTPSAEAE